MVSPKILQGGNDGVQLTNMAITELELMTQQEYTTTQQQEPNIQESHNKTTESEGMTLTTVTTRTPMSHTAGCGWWPGNCRGGGHGHGHDCSTITCFRCGQHGHYASECNATTEEVEKYCGSQTQRTNHSAGEQLLTAGVMQDDPNTDITTNWMFN